MLSGAFPTPAPPVASGPAHRPRRRPGPFPERRPGDPAPTVARGRFARGAEGVGRAVGREVGCRRRALRVALLLALLPALAGGVAAQPLEPLPALRDGGRVMLSVDALARRLGHTAGVSADGTAFTLRAPRGVLTLFADLAEGWWQPRGADAAEELVLSAPVQRRDGAWYAPADAFEPLGVTLGGEALRLPDGRRLPLALPPERATGADFELEDLGNGVVGVRLFAPGDAGPETVSVLVADLGLLPLALPELRAELDALLARAELVHERLLLFVVTSLSEAAWDSRFVVSQAGADFEARHPFRVRVLRGDPQRVAPGSPALGVILLPQSFRLDAPLTLRWAGATAPVTFRR